MVRLGANASDAHHQPRAPPPPQPTVPPPYDDEDDHDLHNEARVQDIPPAQNIHGMQQFPQPHPYDDEDEDEDDDDDDHLNSQAQAPTPQIIHGTQQVPQPPGQTNLGIQMVHQPAVLLPAPQPAVVHVVTPSIQLPNQPWNTHLFDCFSDPLNTVITFLFPCVTFGQIAEIVDSGNTSCASSAISYTCIACCIAMPCLMSCSYRTKLRSKFGLVESPAPDFLVHCFCETCALCQEYRELHSRGIDPSIGWAGNAGRLQQQQQLVIGMAPPMPMNMTMI